MTPESFKALEARVANIEKTLHERLSALEKKAFGAAPSATKPAEPAKPVHHKPEKIS
jgi:hypothetical protein